MTATEPSHLATAIAAAAEMAINGALRYDPASRQEVSRLTGILEIEIKPTSTSAISLFCQGTVDGLRVMGHCTSPVTTRLSGSPTALLGVLQHPHSLADSDVDLSGDMELLQHWQAILVNLDIDWETCLQQYMGDIVAPAIAEALSGAGRWLQEQFNYHRRQLSIYLQEELRLAPARAEFDDFYQQVDELRLATDRLEARVQQVRADLTHRELSKNHRLDKHGADKKVIE